MNRLLVAASLVYGTSAARKVLVRGESDAEESLQRAESSGESSIVKRNEAILCPVLAAMHRAGDLNADSNGNVELRDIYEGLHYGLGVGSTLSSFQAYGISIFDKDHKASQDTRDRCLPGSNTWCYTQRKLGFVNDRTKRWFNLYTMQGKQALEHGISTGVRGGDNNMPPNALDCRGQYPCRARFEQFWLSNVRNGRFYIKDAMRVICMARQFGDRTGEMAYADNIVNLWGDWTFETVPGREWQMKGATTSMVLAFGKADSNGDRYLTASDLEALFMEGRYPSGWSKREWGCLLWGCGKESGLKRFKMDVGECPMGEQDEWWQGSGCKTSTGKSCGTCPQGQACVAGTCRCGRDEAGRSTCFSGGSCKKQSSDGFRWFSQSRESTFTPANNPSPVGNA